MKSYYSQETWKEIESGSADTYRVNTFTYLIKGNLYAFMNKLLEFKMNPEGTHPWVRKTKR